MSNEGEPSCNSITDFCNTLQTGSNEIKRDPIYIDRNHEWYRSMPQTQKINSLLVEHDYCEYDRADLLNDEPLSSNTYVNSTINRSNSDELINKKFERSLTNCYSLKVRNDTVTNKIQSYRNKLKDKFRKVEPYCSIRRIKRKLHIPRCLSNVKDNLLIDHSNRQLDETAGAQVVDDVKDCLHELDKYLDNIDKTVLFNQNDNVCENNVRIVREQSLDDLQHIAIIEANRNNIRISDDELNIDRRIQRRYCLRNSNTFPFLINRNITAKSNIRRVISLRDAVKQFSAICNMKDEKLLKNENNNERDTNSVVNSIETVSNNMEVSEPNTSVEVCCGENLNSRSYEQDMRKLEYEFLNNIVLGEATNLSTPENRPRQFGRRAVRTLNGDPLASQRSLVGNTDFPIMIASQTTVDLHSPNVTTSDISSELSSRHCSPVSLNYSSSSASTYASAINVPQCSSGQNHRLTIEATPPPNSSSDDQQNSSSNEDHSSTPFKCWPHFISRSVACTFCTLGLFNISRFSVLSIHFGFNFLIQFLIFSILFGIPMLWFLMTLGAKIKRGPLSMWYLSPICRGISISLIGAQLIITLYSSCSCAWVFVYLRDSFASKLDVYRWQEIFEFYRPRDYSLHSNNTYNLAETVADYFNGIVLQRLNLGAAGTVGGDPTRLGAIRFQLLFNMSLVWMLIFIILCKGLKSIGKILNGFLGTSLVGLTALAIKLLCSIRNTKNLQNVFSSDWDDFLTNTHSWMSAAQETFLTWSLLGISVISISKSSYKWNTSSKTELRRDAIIVTLITLYGLFISAIIGNAAVQILNDRGFYYFPGSYEIIESNMFLLPSNSPLPSQYATIPLKWLPRYSSVLGESFQQAAQSSWKPSGYQVIRLITEVFPATMAVAEIAPFWAVISSISFILLLLGQLSMMWKPVAELVNGEVTFVLCSCIGGYLLSIPLIAENGIYIIHYLDTVVGGAWWIFLLWVLFIFAIFLIRGRPYTSDLLVNELKLSTVLSTVLAFTWNIVIPIAFLVIGVIEYKSSSSQFFSWRRYSYWPIWARKLAASIQLTFLLAVPLVAFIQVYRYLSRGPTDILERIELLYRPNLHQSYLLRQRRRNENQRTTQTRDPVARTGSRLIPMNTPVVRREETPPKYSPPPSYSTATGARLAKILRNSLRRSVRRINRILTEPTSNDRNSNVLANISLTTERGTRSATTSTEC